MSKLYVGVDVAKQSYEVEVIDSDARVITHASYRNVNREHKKLWRRLQKCDAETVHVCMEATGAYWEDLAESLYRCGAIVYVVNPARVKGFWRAEGLRQKTDRIDAGVIARFIRTQRCQAWTPPSPEMRTLTALVRRMDGITLMLQKEHNRMATVQDEIVRASLVRVISTLEENYRDLETTFSSILAQHPQLAHDFQLLMSITGIAAKTARRVLVFLRRTPYETARQAAAAAGITPSHCISGTSVHHKPRISRMGDARLRHFMYPSAESARRFNPVIAPWAAQLEQRGKTHKAVVCAIERRLIHISFGVLKNQTPFDPQYCT
jgi:transposase